MRDFLFRRRFCTAAVYDSDVGKRMITTTMARTIERMDSLRVSMKLSARQLAVLVGMSPTVLGNAVSGVTYLGVDKERELSEVTLLLMTLGESCRPLRLPEKPDDLRKLLDYVRDHQVQPEQVRAAIQNLFGGKE